MFEQAAGELRAELMSGSRARIGKSRMQFPHGTNQCKLKNRRISTIRFQYLKYSQGNCMRNYWDQAAHQNNDTAAQAWKAP